MYVGMSVSLISQSKNNRCIFRFLYMVDFECFTYWLTYVHYLHKVS